MAYQNVGTPRFYIDDIAYMRSLGLFEMDSGSDIFHSNPSHRYSFGLDPSERLYSRFKRYNVGNAGRPNYFALLGHNLSTQTMGLRHNYYDPDAGWNAGHAQDNIVNGASGCMDIDSVGNSQCTFLQPQNDGFSIVKMTNNSNDGNYLYSVFEFEQAFGTESEKILKFGAIIYGRYYTMPHSPDLKLTMTREMDGVKRIRTKGGADLVNHKYTKPPLWGSAAPWELYSENPANQALSRSGRRIWNLSFSYLADSDVFPDVGSLTNYETISPDGTTWDDSMSVTDNTLLNEDTFYSQVIHKTNGGQLPFIFQPDKDNYNPDGFAIAKFDMKSFQFKQVSLNTYNCKIRIKEVW